MHKYLCHQDEVCSLPQMLIRMQSLIRTLASNASRTPAVKKILASQKTFANHLSDAEALAAAAPSIISSRNPSIAVAATPTPEAKRSHRRKDLNAPAGTPLRKGSAAQVVEKPDTLLPIPPLNTAEPEWAMPHRRTPADEDPLLMSKIPPMPSQEEIDALLRAPPLTYWEASATLNEGAPPPRKFCALCGYWGRVRCKGCGMRVCALECLRSHEEECYKRYGA